MGKTSITLSVISNLKAQGHINKTLIVAPVRPAYDSWPGELSKWSNFKDLTYTIITSSTKEKALQEDVDIYIVTTDLVKWLFNADIEIGKRKAPKLNFDRVEHLNLDLLVIDELSKFKNMKSARTRVMKEISKLFDRRMGLTGSFAPNHLVDVFAETLIIAGEDVFGKYITHFKEKYFDKLPTFGRNFEKLTPKPDAFDKVCRALAPVSIHLKAEDYLDMPERLNTNLYAELPPRAFSTYKVLEKDFIAHFKDKTITAQNAATKAMSLRQIASGGIYTYTNIEKAGIIERVQSIEHIHNAKTEILADLVSELQGQPLLILYHFKHDKKRICDLLGEVPDLSLCKTPDKLNELISRWNSGNLPLMLGQPQSMGHGLNLQKGGHHICFYSLDWSFENYDQSIRRLYRQGNEHSTIFVYHILAKGTIDDYLLKILNDKEETQDKILKHLNEYCKGVKNEV